MDINWDVDTDKGSTYDTGPFRVRIEAIEDTLAKSGNPQLRIKTVFADGKYEGKKLTDHIVLIDNCTWKLKKFVQAMGVDITTVKSTILSTTSAEFRGLLNKFIGKTTVWVIGTKTWDGKLQNEIVDYQVDPQAEAAAKEEEWLD